MAQLVKTPLAMQETWVQSLGWADPLEKGKATHSSMGLENSMDCIVHGVAKSQTQPRDFHYCNYLDTIFIYIHTMVIEFFQVSFSSVLLRFDK